jgi:protein gp37
MAHNTEIGWTHVPGYRGETWNPWTGCTKVSPGCAHCYIEDTPPFRKIGVRFENGKIPITVYPDRLQMPLRWKKPRAVFVNSMSDLFHEDIADSQIAEVFDVMARAAQHTFMVLTKRPERMRDLLNLWEFPEGPLPNVWLGVTIENRRMVHRADLLRQTPAAVRFISAEPLLGPLIPELAQVFGGDGTRRGERSWEDDYDGPGLDLTGIDWVIIGGESGPKHRPVDPLWVRQLREWALVPRIRRADQPGLPAPQAPGDAAIFFKQWGGRTPKAGGRELDGRTWDEFPVVPEPVTA